MKKKYIALLIFLSIIFIYLSGVVVFSYIILPNTYVNGIDCSFLTIEKANDIYLEKNYPNTEIKITGVDGRELVVTKDDFDFSGIRKIEDVIYKNDKYFWFVNFFVKQEYNINNDEKIMEKLINNLHQTSKILDESTWYDSMDAHIKFNEREKCYEVVPHIYGNRIDIDAFDETIIKAVTTKDYDFENITDNWYISEKPKVFEADLVPVVERLNFDTDFIITISGSEGELVFDRTFAIDFVSKTNETKEDSYYFDLKNCLSAMLSNVYEKFNTAENGVKFTTTLGDDVIIQTKKYGNRVDKEKTEEAMRKAYEDGGTQNIEVVYEYTKEIEKLKNYIEIDLTNQHLYMYKENELVLETDIVSGNLRTKHKTPAGIFKLSYKTKNATLKGPGYSSFVYYWMPFNGGIGMHDATWRTKFGGEIYKTDGSHGCINMPKSAAKTMYENINNDYYIICYWR